MCRVLTGVAPDVVASADPERVRQVLVDLLANAAKFTPDGCIRLLASMDRGRVRIAVEDTGPGIDPALGDRLLEPFAHGATPGAGSGLGLAIVSRLLHVLDGELAIDSAPGRGTRVEVRLPGRRRAGVAAPGDRSYYGGDATQGGDLVSTGVKKRTSRAGGAVPLVKKDRTA